MDQQEILKRIDALTEKLGVTSGYIWEITVRQQTISAYILIATFAFISLVTVTWYKYFNRRSVTSTIANNNYEEIAIFGAAIGTVIASILFVVVAVGAIPTLLNPEYAALKDLVKAIK